MSNHSCENLNLVNYILFLWRSISNTAQRFDTLFLAGIGEKTIVSNLHEILRNDMKKKPSDKFFGCNGHIFDLTVIAVILV